MALKGREIQLKMLQFLHYPKENTKESINSIFRYSTSTLPWIETIPTYLFLFWVVQNFRSISRPLNNDLEKNDFSNFNCIWSELSKTVRDLKIGWSLANGPR